MQATVSDLSDEDVVINFCLQNKIAKTAIDELLRRGYNSLEALALVEMEDLVSPKIPKGQRRLILHIAATLQRKKTESSLNSSAGATENGAASVAVSTETTDISTTNQQPVTISDEGARRGVSVNRGTSESFPFFASQIYLSLQLDSLIPPPFVCIRCSIYTPRGSPHCQMVQGHSVP